MGGIICLPGWRANRYVAMTRYCLGVFLDLLLGISGLVNDGFLRISEIKLWLFYICGFSEDITTVKEVIKQLLQDLVFHCGARCHCIRSNAGMEYLFSGGGEGLVTYIASVSVRQKIEIDLHRLPNFREVLCGKRFVCSEPAVHKNMRADPAAPIGQALDAVQFSTGTASP